MRLLFLLVLALVSPICACEWDRDTLAAEAKGLPGTLEIITGRFERNPPLFYEMRLKRVTQEIKTQPNKLELYDDAGVACDRLHKGDEAIGWMAKKRAQLKPFPQDKEHWYRYHANLGTFQAHRWLRNGASRKMIDEMKTARDNIKRAIEINPDAHFGREKYQLMAMEWIIKPPKNYRKGQPGVLNPNDINSVSNSHGMVEGLSGLIVLGEAWQSIDIFVSLSQALANDKTSSYLALAAQQRAEELIDSGRKSLAPGAPTGKKLKDAIAAQWDGWTIIDTDKTRTVAEFRELRNEADAWQEQRAGYMVAKLKQGQHPDTDSSFWNGWQEPIKPEIYGELPPSPTKYWLLLAGTLFCSLVIVNFASRKRRRAVV